MEESVVAGGAFDLLMQVMVMYVASVSLTTTTDWIHYVDEKGMHMHM